MTGDEHAPAGTRPAAVVRWILVAALGLAAVISVTAYFRQDHGPVASAEHLYYCPMHPQIVQDHPGECPICGMTLVPKRQETRASSDAGVAGLVPIQLTAERIQLGGIRTAPVRRAPLAGGLRANAVVAASERGLAQITLRFAGYIETLLVAETGQRVRRGEVLATVYSPEVLRVEQELVNARGWKSESGGTLDADARHRLELLGIAAPEIDEVLRRGQASASVKVRAPVDGFVITRNAVAGGAVQMGMPLFEIADLSTVWVLAEIPESALGRVRLGAPARLLLDAYPGESFVGKVALVAPTVDPSTRTLRVRVALRNPTGPSGPRLRPGMFGTVALDLPSAPALVVPAESVVDTGQAQYVFVAHPEGRFEPRLVRRGASAGDEVEILDGLANGELVVTTAGFLLDSESRLEASVSGAKR
jgi:Cu(I)/Ag(I) efflux system membrane fusion protein